MSTATRRAVLRNSALGLGWIGLQSLLAAASPNSSALTAKVPHFAPRAKRLIFLFMHGGPSSIDTFDPKPRLEIDHGKPLPIKRELTFGADSVGGLMVMSSFISNSCVYSSLIKVRMNAVR